MATASISINTFKARRYLSPFDYYAHIGEAAVKAGLLSNAELKEFSGKFRRMRLSPTQTINALDVIVKSRWEKRDAINYFNEVNKETNKSPFFGDILKTFKTKKKKQ